MKTELLNHRILLAAVVICGMLASLTLTSSETHAFDLSGNGNLAAPGLIETDPDSIPVAAQEQAERTRLPVTKVPTLGCCKCLGGTNTLDLSTISSNQWIVTNPSNVSSPVVVVSPMSTAWNLTSGLAKWVSTVASAGTNNISPGTYDYRLKFVVPACAIEQRVTLSGTYGGDNFVGVYLDSAVNLISSCSGTGGGCFSTTTAPPPITNYLVPGFTHTLLVRVQNSGGPSGMFINAKLTGTCIGATADANSQNSDKD